MLGRKPAEAGSAANAAETAKKVSMMDNITESWLKAAKEGDMETLKSLRASGMDINQMNKFGEMAVHYAAALGQMEVLEWLYSHGASFRHGNDMGATPLHMAVSHAQEKIVIFMLERGVDPNLRTKRGASALHIASATASLNLVKLLVSAGADPRAKTQDGQTPIDYAIKGGNNEIILFLESSGLSAGPSSSGHALRGRDRIESIQKQIQNTAAAPVKGSGSAGPAAANKADCVNEADADAPAAPDGNDEAKSEAADGLQQTGERSSKSTSVSGLAGLQNNPGLSIDVGEATNDEVGSDPSTTTSITASASSAPTSPPPPKLSPQLVSDALRAAKLSGDLPRVDESTARPTTDPVPSSTSGMQKEPTRNPLVEDEQLAAASATVAAHGGHVKSMSKQGRMYDGYVAFADPASLEDYIYKYTPPTRGSGAAVAGLRDPRNWRRVIVRLVQNYLLVFKSERENRPGLIISLEDAMIRDSSLEIGVMHTFSVTHFSTGTTSGRFGAGVLDEHHFQTRGTGDVDSWVQFLSQSTRAHAQGIVDSNRQADTATRAELEDARRALEALQLQNEHMLQEALARESPIGEERRTVERMRGQLGASAKMRNAIGMVPWDDVSASSARVEVALKKVEQKRRMLLMAAGGARQGGGGVSHAAAPKVASSLAGGAIDSFNRTGRGRRDTFAPAALKHLTNQVTGAEKFQDAMHLSAQHQTAYARRQQELHKEQSKSYKVYYGSADDESNLVGEMDVHENETVMGLRRHLARELKMKRDSFALRFGDTATLGPREHLEVQAISVDERGPIVILPLAA